MNAQIGLFRLCGLLLSSIRFVVKGELRLKGVKIGPFQINYQKTFVDKRQLNTKRMYPFSIFAIPWTSYQEFWENIEDHPHWNFNPRNL